MWMAPLLYAALSIFFWKYVGAVFMPQLLARSIFAFAPGLLDIEMVVLWNVALIYFGAYAVFAIFWKRLKPYLRNAFLAGIVLWLVNVFVVYPVIGRGVLGYRLPQGWMSASFPLLVSHWIFARGLQFQERR
jgi:hypothetical protein